MFLINNTVEIFSIVPLELFLELNKIKTFFLKEILLLRHISAFKKNRLDIDKKLNCLLFSN